MWRHRMGTLNSRTVLPFPVKWLGLHEGERHMLGGRRRWGKGKEEGRKHLSPVGFPGLGPETHAEPFYRD